MKIAWATDIHLNHAGEAAAGDFCSRVRESGAELLLVGGDFAEADTLENWLHFLGERVQRPIYFVLGNHDYYGGDVATVRRRMRDLDSPWARWMPNLGRVDLTARSGLVGHGGWGDARIGNTKELPVLLNDYFLIKELSEAAGTHYPLAVVENKEALRQKLRELGDDAAAALRPELIEAIGRFEEVIVLTHVPPFRESCWHDGKTSDEDWLPGFTCRAIGDMLLEVVGARPETRVTVLCGHTHGGGEARLLPNLSVSTQPANYGRPDFRLLDVAD